MSAWRSVLTGWPSHRTVRPPGQMGDKCFLIRDPYRVDGVVGGEAQLPLLYWAPSVLSWNARSAIDKSSSRLKLL